jgi:hypothetical protein
MYASVGFWMQGKEMCTTNKTDWLIICCFTSRSRIFHGDITIADEGLQNLGQCLALGAFEQGGIFKLCHTCCDTGLKFFLSHPKDRSIQSPLTTCTTHKGMWRICSYPDPHGSPFSCLLRHRSGCGGPILTRWGISTLSKFWNKNLPIHK